MTTAKKIMLVITGPGVLLFEAVVVFIQLFTTTDTRRWIFGGLIIFFVVFIPLYTIEYFKQEFRKDKNKQLHFRKKNTRTEWSGGNIHGKVPREEERPGKFFKD
jgi:Ni/Fe-hydrogenase subunit HybB-like protein